MRFAFAVLLVASIFSGALLADRITYWKAAGAKRTAETLDNVVVIAWNAKEVSSRTADNKPAPKVETGQIITISRSVGEGGSMGKDLQDALEAIAADPVNAREALAAAATKGTEVDKEEAMYRRAELFESDAHNGKAALTDAIRELQAYTAKYKAGFFARDAYAALAELQVDAGKGGDARSTLKAMIGADGSLARTGNQKLGELEVMAKDLKAALDAFKAAAAASGEDRNAKYLAIAWQGAVMQRSGDNNGAKDTLEKITGDESFEDETSEDDEVALSVAWPALGEAHFASGNFEKAYNAYVLGAYYVWWNQGTLEGQCLRQACICAKKLTSTDEKWKARYDKLRTTLAMGYPKEVPKVDEAK